MGLSMHRFFAQPAVVDPSAPIRQRVGRTPLLGDGEELLKGSLRVRNNPEVGGEDAADLRRFDVDVNESPSLAVGLESTGVPVGPPVADSEHEVGLEHGRVAVAMGGLQSDHAGGQPVIVGDCAPTHQGRNHRDIEDLCELHQQIRGVGVDDAAAGDDERTFGRHQHVNCLGGLGSCRRGLVDGQWLIGVGVEVDLGQLDVDGQIDEDRAGPPRAHQMKRLSEGAGNLARFEHRHRHLGHGRGDGGDVDGLEVLFVEPAHWRLAGDREDRNGIR